MNFLITIEAICFSVVSLAPGMDPVVDGFFAHIEFQSGIMDPLAAAELQQVLSADSKILIRLSQ